MYNQGYACKGGLANHIHHHMRDIEVYHLLYEPQKFISINLRCDMVQKTMYLNAQFVKRSSKKGAKHQGYNHCQYQMHLWQSIAMYFFFGLPRSIQGNNGIWTILSCFSKQAHFLPIKKTIQAKNMATLFISQVFKHHGMLTSIVLDRDPIMTSLFWRGMFENLGTRLNF